ncbi:flagellin [Comamonas aquatica]|nr:flagellin [Comamonas aquatica]
MAMVINTNISSLNAQRQLAGSANKLGTAMERLSSGLRINSAKDDAAGLAISSRMTTQITGLNVAQRNANDGISLAQTAEGALSTIGNNLQRIRELAVQSRNATNSSDDRAALQEEVDQLKAEITRVAETTKFNGTNLLDGSFIAQDFQVGADQGQTIRVNTIVNASADSLGSWTSAVEPTNSKNLGLAAAAGVTVTAKAAAGDAATERMVALKIGSVEIGKTYTNDTTAAVTVTSATVAKDLDNEIRANMKALSDAGYKVSGSLADGNLVVSNTNTDATVAVSYQTDAVTAGTLADVASTVTEDTVASATAITLAVAKKGESKTGFADLSIKSVEGADNAILAMDGALKQVNSARAQLGAIQNRFESVVSNLATTSENLTASRSRILDADFAVETANLSSAQVLQQAGTAMVAQANQLPQNVLSLLR